MEVVISARVPEEELKILKKKGINVSEIVRTSIIEVAEKEKLKESQAAISRMARIIKKIDRVEFIRSVRDDRNEAH